MGLDTTTATEKLMLHIMGSVAEFERAIMLERQREEIAKAKAEGNSKAALQLLNEKPVKLSNLRNEVQRLRRLEKGVPEISRASVFRVLKKWAV